jgi:hypothetical protein
LSLFLAVLSAAHAQSLAGDCDGDGKVVVGELVLGVNIALAAREVGECSALDRDSDGRVEIDELVAAVDASIGSTIRVNGMCLRPGPASAPPPGLVPCETGMTVQAFRCESEDRARCLLEPSALTVLNFGSINAAGQFTLTLGRNEVSGATLVFEAQIAGQTMYRTLAFGPIAAGSGAGAGEELTLEIVISPTMEAATRLVDENGLESFDDEGVAAVAAAVEQANQETNFAGQGDEGGAVVAADVARADPGVQQTLQERLTPSPTATLTVTPTGTATPTSTASLTPTSTPEGERVQVRVVAPPVGAVARSAPSAGQAFLSEGGLRTLTVTLLAAPAEMELTVDFSSTEPGVADVVGTAAITPGSRTVTFQIQSGSSGKADIRIRAAGVVRDLEVIVGEPENDERPTVLAPIVGVESQ